MSAIITAVFKATIGWIVDNGRDKAAEKLKDGDVTDQQFCGIIMREIDAMKSKLDGLSRKDLLASISFSKEGIELLYEAFDYTKSRSEYGADTVQAACAETVSLTEEMRNLELTESGTRKLANAKKRFERAREMATIAFSNEALSTTDRILAMQYRVMATVLETIDHPADAVTPCKVCIEELNSLPVVQQSVKVQIKRGISAVKGLFKKEERRKIISDVCRVNRVVYDVTQTIYNRGMLLLELPSVDAGEERVDLLRDGRVGEALRKQGTEHLSVSWIHGQDGEEQHRINQPRDIATNPSGQYIIADDDLTIKVFDKSGKFLQRFRLPALIDDHGTELLIESWSVRLATDINNNIYVLVRDTRRVRSCWIFKFDRTADQHHTFRVRKMGFDCYLCKLSVSEIGKVIVLKGNWTRQYYTVDVYGTDGQFVCSFGEQIFRNPVDITTVSDSRVMVVDRFPSCSVHIFSEEGDHLNKFDLRGSFSLSCIAYHWESQEVVLVIAHDEEELLQFQIYTKDGEFLRSIFIHVEKLAWLYGMAVSTEGRIAVVTDLKNSTSTVNIM